MDVNAIFKEGGLLREPVSNESQREVPSDKKFAGLPISRVPMRRLGSTSEPTSPTGKKKGFIAGGAHRFPSGHDVHHKKFLSVDYHRSVSIPANTAGSVGSSPIGGSVQKLASYTSTDSISTPLSSQPSQDLSTTFDRCEFWGELTKLAADNSPASYLYLRSLLWKIITDPDLHNLRCRLVQNSEVDDGNQQLVVWIKDVWGEDLRPCKKNKKSGVKVDSQKKEEISKKIEDQFPSCSIQEPFQSHMWTDSKLIAENQLGIDISEIDSKNTLLLNILEPLSCEYGLEPGDLREPAGYYRPDVVNPVHHGDVEVGEFGYFIPVRFAFTLDDKSQAVPEKHLHALATRSFLRLCRAKLKAVTSEDCWNKLTRREQELLGGEVLNDESSVKSDANRFDCEFEIAHGTHLPSLPVFSSRQYRAQYRDKKGEVDTLAQEAVGQKLVSVLNKVGHFSPEQIQFVKGILQQGPLNEIMNYCTSAYFPDQEILYSMPTQSKEASSNQVAYTKIKVTDWGGGCIEIRCELVYDSYKIKPQDKDSYDATTKVCLRVIAESAEKDMHVSCASMEVDVKRSLSFHEKISLAVTKADVLRKNKQSAAGHFEDEKGEYKKCARKITQAKDSQYSKIAEAIINDDEKVDCYVAGDEEQEIIKACLKKEYSKSYEKNDAIIERLKKCQSIRKFRAGVVEPLPEWILQIKPEDDSLSGCARVDKSDSRLIYTNSYGWVVTNLPESETANLASVIPGSYYLFQKGDNLAEKKGGLSFSVPVSGSSTPKVGLRRRYSKKVEEFDRTLVRSKWKGDSKAKLMEYFSLSASSSRKNIMAKVKERIGSDISQFEWEDNLGALLDDAQLNKKEKSSVITYAKRFFGEAPRYTRHLGGSLSSLDDTSYTLAWKENTKLTGRVLSDPNFLEAMEELPDVSRKSETTEQVARELSEVEQELISKYVDQFNTLIHDTLGSQRAREDVLRAIKKRMRDALESAGLEEDVSRMTRALEDRVTK